MRIGNLKTVFRFTLLICGLTFLGKCQPICGRLCQVVYGVDAGAPDLRKMINNIEFTGYPEGEVPVSPGNHTISVSIGKGVCQGVSLISVMR